MKRLKHYRDEEAKIIGIAEGDSGKELGLKPFPPELKKLNPSLRQGQLYYIWKIAILLNPMQESSSTKKQ